MTFAWEYWGRRIAGLRAIVLIDTEMSRCSKTLANEAGGSTVVEMNRNQRRRAMNFAFSGRDTIQSLSDTGVEDLTFAEDADRLVFVLLGVER